MADYKALVIDYEPRGIRQLSEPLESAGFEVHVAQDGEAGRKAFDNLKPDIALIEAMLPKRHGFDLCADLKKTAHGAKTPIIIVTSVYRGRKYRQQAIHQYNCDEFMEKPVEAERLLSTVRKLVEQSRVAQGLPPTPEPVHVEPPVPAAAPVAAPAAARVAAPVRTPPPAQPAQEEEDDDISRRLDELLGGNGSNSPGTPKAALRSFETTPNVVSFEATRPRRADRGTNLSPAALDITAIRTGPMGSGSRQAQAHAVVPRESRPIHAPEPELRQSRPPRPTPKPRSAPATSSSRRTRLLVFLLVVTIGLALLSQWLVQG